MRVKFLDAERLIMRNVKGPVREGELPNMIHRVRVEEGKEWGGVENASEGLEAAHLSLIGSIGPGL